MQVKCPECRAEHRIPYQGIQGFPTNVTLQRFLELHIEITGELPDPTSGQVMERCNVCSEKAYCSLCHHCDKKVCEECKGAHMEILRREIARINNQVQGPQITVCRASSTDTRMALTLPIPPLSTLDPTAAGGCASAVFSQFPAY